MEPVMKTTPLALAAAALLSLKPAFADTPYANDFDQGSDSWRVVVDGVMGGRSTGNVATPNDGVLSFTGSISLDNNGGFSQVRTAVPSDAFGQAQGVEIRVRGDGRKYIFDLRASNVRMMAGGFQQEFKTTKGQWKTIRLPLDQFRLVSFGRDVPNAPALDRNRIESIGITLADKNEGPFKLEIDSIEAYSKDTAPSASAPSQDADDLASVAQRAGLTTLLSLLEVSGLELPSGEPLTVLAPTNDAFAALPKAVVARLLTPEGKSDLLTILKHHVVPSRLASAELLSRRTVSALSGQRLAVNTDTEIRIGESGVLAFDVPFQGGVVHVIDAVLLPELRSIQTLTSDTDALSTLSAAIAASGIGDQLGSENGPWTVFAPANSAFENLPAGALETLLKSENRDELIRVLGLHLVPGRLYANELITTGKIQTYFGVPIEFSLENGRLRVGDAGLITTDIEAGNGLVHIIDSVLLPSAQPDSSVAVLAIDQSAQAARILALAITRGVPLFNGGQRAGCAAVYELAVESVVALGSNGLSRNLVQRLELSLAEAEAVDSPTERAWIYRKAMDEVNSRLTRPAQESF
ncbi:MAG: transforming growth factor-beta-induced protein [Phycisphaerales bacterium]|jgi:transforming growth factor-beta-induced protein